MKNPFCQETTLKISRQHLRSLKVSQDLYNGPLLIMSLPFNLANNLISRRRNAKHPSCGTPTLRLAPSRLSAVAWDRESGGAQSTGVSQRVRVTGRDESQSVPFPEKLFKKGIWRSHFLRESLPSCSPHSAGCTCTFLHPQEPLNAPFLKGLFSSGFSRGKTAPQDEIGETPH